MSKIFSANRKKIGFEYEFLDGTKANFIYRQPSSKDSVEVAKSGEVSVVATLETIKKVAMRNISCEADKANVAKLIKEQYEEADLYSFVEQLNLLIEQEKEKK